MDVRELLWRDQGIEVRICGGAGRRDDPYRVEKCRADVAAFTQVQLLRGISHGLGELWRIIEWSPCQADLATEVIRIETVRFTPAQIQTSTRSIYFDTRAVEGTPHALHPLTSWQGPPGTPTLPYELGWLHFDQSIDNVPFGGPLNQTVLYSGAGAKVSIYVYAKSGQGMPDSREAELERASALIFGANRQDLGQVFEKGLFATRAFLSSDDVTAVGVADCDPYFVKARLTYIGDCKMQELMNATLQSLADCVAATLHSRQ